MATRQNSTNGKPKSPRIQVVLPELICEQLNILANNESRTVSNMAKVLIQEGIKKYFEKKGQSFFSLYLLIDKSLSVSFISFADASAILLASKHKTFLSFAKLAA